MRCALFHKFLIERYEPYKHMTETCMQGFEVIWSMISSLVCLGNRENGYNVSYQVFMCIRPYTAMYHISIWNSPESSNILRRMRHALHKEASEELTWCYVYCRCEMQKRSRVKKLKLLQ